ncbi:hypothetical protein L1987_79748 [Smallanthus sonchifolius]|uniref:Uncharacterized protein n=1 Tax=Smallanthus sonchifolius TaxID=185202 RepID=A0ACB8YLB2_9ASTR|nr:hypothetical protein L1987_79748 [Smallanthus sonchifolius]
METLVINLLSLQFLFILTTVSSSNFTLYGTAHINQTTITLTQHLTNCTSNPPFPNTGRIFYKHPIQFLHSSFSTHFSFLITPPPPPCLSGEGIAFFITSATKSLPYSLGSIGLPQSVNPNSPHASFLAVEFDTNFDKPFGDINDNHVGIDSDSVISVASVDLTSIGIDLKSGKPINSWIEYNSSQNVIQIWVGYSDTKPDSPVLAAPMDLSKRVQRFNGFMYVGFSASNGPGSSVHAINNWEFTTFESGSVYPNFEVEEVGSDNCMICFSDISRNKPGSETEPALRKIHHTDKTGLKLAIGLLVVNLILVVVTVCCVVKPTVVIQSVTSERSPEVMVKGGVDDVVTSWGTPTSHFSKV